MTDHETSDSLFSPFLELESLSNYFRSFELLKDLILWTGMTRWNKTHFKTEDGFFYKPRESDRFDTAFQKELIMMKDGTVQNLLSYSVKGQIMSSSVITVVGQR